MHRMCIDISSIYCYNTISFVHIYRIGRTLSTVLTFDTVVDEWVRQTGLSRKALAREIRISTATLLKARAMVAKRRATAPTAF